jgi:enoyl-[acyl-carrier protein] reductase II
MYPEVLRAQIQKVQAATPKPFAVNLPLLYPNIEEHLQSCIDYQVPVVITSAGNPGLYTHRLKEKGIKVLHVVSSAKFALKAQAAGVDAVIAEGFEAGGHNGREETTTLVLVPSVCDAVEIPVVAAGGISDGRSMAAALVLGADAVQMGSRYVATQESSAHEAFKTKVMEAGEGSTTLTLKELTPVRLLHNPFYQAIQEAYERRVSQEELTALLGRGRAKKGMFEGDLEAGELEIGQVAARISDLPSAQTITKEIHEAALNILTTGS